MSQTKPVDEEERIWELPVQCYYGDGWYRRLWRSWADRHLCGTLVIERPEVPPDRSEMRRLLHEALQEFGDALLAEWEKDPGGQFR